MRVLLPIFCDQVFPREQAEGLRAHCEVDTSFNAFWENRGAFDIIQLNWPEELAEWREPTSLELMLLKCVLARWRSQAKIVVTRHNFHPHYADTERNNALYETVYSAADAIVHLGEFSRCEYGERYAALGFPEHQYHVVIPHPVFESYPDNIDGTEARNALGINAGTFVLLAFGRVQSAVEKNLVVDAFLNIPRRNKIALVPSWQPALGKEPVNRLKWARVSHSRRFRLENRFVPEEEVAAYFRAADLVLIPRENVLNSGLVSLCVKFDCPVLAPNCGNVTDTANAMGSNLFNPRNAQSLRRALEEAVLEAGKEVRYSDLRKSHSKATIAQRYFSLYQAIV